ncbi:altronate dehydratase [Caldalkalibacillus uzonensis]|uniref:Altronate dehydratase n=1 Tax=Caldalkalibacillus uzonensis TaxID=353224 RepID=A0ABU0CWL4_9BACI|nr:UxaA family hydrolase [Caldalkalibacillus uzonensis]MDQ0340813.1 altronate dehydratase [Caldalkalibacillus uzonensis]
MSQVHLIMNQKEKLILVIDPKDNVGVALTDIREGDTCIIRRGDIVEQMTALDNIPFGHKIALTNVEKDEPVYKYGEEIGKMKEGIKRGGWIHSHNMYCERGMG